MHQFAFPVLGKFASKNCLDMLGIPSNDNAPPAKLKLDNITILGAAFAEHVVEMLQHAIVCLHIGCLEERVQYCVECKYW